MADKKKPIKQCRVKADTCFKWHCIGKLFGLSLEDIGLMYLISQIKDDEGKIIYGLIEEEILDLYQATEAEWLALHTAKMRNDEKYRMAFAELNGQRKTTTERYKQEVARREAYNARIAAQQDGTEDTENGKPAEVVITSEETKQDTQETPQGKIEEEQEYTDEFLQYNLHTPVDDVFPVPDVVYLEIWKESKPENLPTEEDWESLLEEFDDDFLKAFVIRGNKDRWKKHYSEYLEREDI